MTGELELTDGSLPSRQTLNEHLYVVAREAGHSNPELPTWASASGGLVDFDASAPAAICKHIEGVPGAFQLLNVLSDDECRQFVDITEALGYQTDAPVSLPHDVRHMCNVNWVVDESVDGPIWERCRDAVAAIASDTTPLGLNARFRCYRYGVGDYFKPHKDGSWTGSRVIEGRLIADAYGDRWSQMTFLLLLSDGYEGGRTIFHVPQAGADARQIAVRTPKGAALCFPHGVHPLHCLHAGERVDAGRKYMIRTDILFAV